MRAILELVACFLLFFGAHSAQQPQAPPFAESVPPYPNSPNGLVTMMNDMVALAKQGDVAAVTKYSQSLTLPRPEVWFRTQFGDDNCGAEHMAANDCLGSRLALTYSSIAKGLPNSVPKTLHALLDENLTTFEAVNYSQPCPAPERIVPALKLVDNLSTTPILSPVLSGLIHHREPVYVLWTYNEKRETTLAFFVYSDGAFRYIGMPHPASLEEFVKKAEIPQPSELTDEIVSRSHVLADQALAQRTVVLHVIIGPDGKARQVSYVRGPEAFEQVAIEKVQKRNFGARTLAGHPIQVDTCISVKVH